MKTISSLLFGTLVSMSAQSAPWVTPDDVYLRADIQRLADKGIIEVPINRWPIMWSDLATDLLDVKYELLTDDMQDSYARVMFNFNQARNKQRKTKVTLQAATDNPKFTHFGSSFSEHGQLQVENEFIIGNLAGKLQVNHILDAEDDKDFRLDGSYLAYKLGNWSVTAGYVPMWWGPGWDTALLMSTNARPIPGVTLSRINSDAFETRWLSWIGPWSFTTFMGQLEDKGRVISKPLFWASKISIRPFKQLEFSASRSTLWGGDGRGSSLSDFWDIIFPSESDNKINNSTDVNDLGSIDLRWSHNLLGQPFGLYYEMAFEDYGISSLAPSKRSHLIGFDSDITTQYGLFSLFAEYSDTYHKECACVYEHDIYQTGYTHRGKVIGSTYGKNAQSTTLGVLAQLKTNRQWHLGVSKIELNKDNENSMAINDAEQYQDIVEARASYRFIFMDARWDISALYRNTDVNFGDSNGDEGEVSLSWEYKL